MTAIAFFWYVGFWAGLACWAIDTGRVTVGNLIYFAVLGPVGAIAGLWVLAESRGVRVDAALWERRGNGTQ